MLLLLLKLSLFVQTDSLDLIYDNFYQNQNNYKEQINLVTDKDYYLPGEKLSFFVQVNPLNNLTKIKSSWGYIYLFDKNRKVIDHARFFLKDGNATGVLLVPDSVNSKNLYLTLATPYTSNAPVKCLGLLTNFIKCSENKIDLKTKSKYLIPNKVNELSFSSSNFNGQNAAIINENNELIAQFWLKVNGQVSFIPLANQNYFLKVNNQKLALPKVKPTLNINAKMLGDKIEVNFNNLASDVNDNILMVSTGREILWLSYLTGNESRIEIPVEQSRYRYVFCLLLDKKFKIIDSKILAHKGAEEQIDYVIKNDTLILNIPALTRNLPFLIRAVESNYQVNKLTFSSNERSELSYFGTVPNNIFFSNNLEKLNWLNCFFKIDIKILTQSVEQTKEIPLSKIIYHLPNDTKIDNNLIIHAVDYNGRIINFDVQAHKVLINPSEFESKESLLMLSAYYKKRKLKLTKDSIVVLKDLENYIRDFFNNKNYLQHERENASLNYRHQLKKIQNIEVLKEITVTDKKYKNHYPGRGTSKTFRELKLDKYTSTALDLLPQIGVSSIPDIPTGYILSKKRYFSLDFHNHEEYYYPMYLIVSGPGIINYSGYDFNKLFEYDAKWVVNITKIGKQPEGVVVSISPGFRGENNFVSHEKIFTQATLNDNSGVIYWNFDPNGNNKKIKIPLTNVDGSVSWTLQFFEPNGNTIEYKGIYEYSVEK